MLTSLPLGAQTPITLKAENVEARKVCEYLAYLLRARFVVTDVARYEVRERIDEKSRQQTAKER